MGRRMRLYARLIKENPEADPSGFFVCFDTPTDILKGLPTLFAPWSGFARSAAMRGPVT